MVAARFFNSHLLHRHGHVPEQQDKLTLFSQVSLNCRPISISRTSSISFSAKNCFSSLQLPENPFQKPVPGRDSSCEDSVINLSFACSKIRGYVDDASFEDAIRVYLYMLNHGFPPIEFQYFPCLIKAFGGFNDVGKCRQIHGHLLKLGFLADVYVVNSLLGVYWKCWATEDATKMFENMHERDLVSWNTAISGFCQSGDHVTSLMIFRRMIQEFTMNPSRVACLSGLSSCASVNSLILGREIHGFLVKTGLYVDEFLICGLIEMYMKCGVIKNAENIFQGFLNETSKRGNTVIWNVMIWGYVSNGHLSMAMELFIEMLELGINLDSSTVVALLVLCSQFSDLNFGKQIHGLIFSHGVMNDARVETALVEMYFNCGAPEIALKIFSKSQNHNAIMWGTMISNCAQNGDPNKALEWFRNFMLECGFPDSIILLAALRACSLLTLKPQGMAVHALVVKTGFDSDVFVGGALVDMYGKCGDMESAQDVFQELSARDLVSWNALISGFCQKDYADKALKALHDMQSENIKPNSVTAACLLSVCAQLSLLYLCKEVHCFLLRQGLGSNILGCNSLITAYAKCGDINSSQKIFYRMPTRDKISWNSVLLACGMHGCTDEMFSLFEMMKKTGVTPDHAAFTAVLSTCSHTGEVDKGWKYFNSMVTEYKLEPAVEHYTCMADLLGRAGYLSLAYDVIKTMPCVPDDRIWGSLLGSCRSHGDTRLAEAVANHIFKLDPTSVGYRVVLANLFEDAGKWSEVSKVRSEIKKMGLKKQPGCSWIEIDNKIHVFVAGDSSHHQSEEIYATIESLTLEMGKTGYIPFLQSTNIVS
ncbi:hypothetical protein HS088_TW15G00248 [Tripterygium wilfordii]|uniref:Pentatricopeptide repeat-containing protein n=1 Tax=Tripterygium wilfordii TaxID=458696 RepID=A0A7J7CLC1_TRIWF|nr:pentatricopeptide repeat-containing protein At4g21300-like [Tripterygium wilfordii]KAF5734756.1 hypothetical protein HS088_TW15G00248 [Tripterygium wilfordii]